MLNVHMLHAPEDTHLKFLRQQLNDTINLTLGKETIPDDVHILIGGRPSREQLMDKPNLHTLFIPFAGLPKETATLMRDFPHIAVHNLHHNAPMTAEMALALLFGTAKHLIPVDQSLRQNDWTVRYENVLPSMILDGKTILIVGYGAIGKIIGRVCEALNMTVLGIRRTPDDADNIYPPSALHDLLPKADVLMIALPGTSDTEGMIGEEEISLLPKGAILVNVGRGLVVDQQALYEALKRKHLFGAGIDVWYNYPRSKEARIDTAPADFPFNELDNIVMSPHRAGGGGADEVEYRRMQAIADLLNTVVRGNPMPNKIDLNAGY